MYLKLLESDEQEDQMTLKYHCPNCNTVKESEEATQNSHLVFFKSYGDHDDETAGMNEYTRYDPTLPTTNAVPCPNEKCPSNDTGDEKMPRNIIYVRHNTVSLKYMYQCRHCNITWKSSNF